MMFFSILGSLLFIFLSLRLGGTISLDIPLLGRVLEMRPIFLAICILIIFWSYGFIAAFIRKIFKFFGGKPSHEKGLYYLQMALSGILLKDRKLTAKSILKAKKYLGDIPMVSWLEGQMMLLNDDPHKAKAIFYKLSAKEKDTTLGAYSICSMAIKEGSNSDAINAIDSIIKTYPNAYDLIFQAISLSLKELNFLRARKYLPYIKNTKKSKIVEAIICAEEGSDLCDQELMKKAFKMAPELSINAINYSESLKNEGSFWRARRVLLKSFEYVKFPGIYEKYVRCSSKVSGKSFLELSKKISKELPESWIENYRLLRRSSAKFENTEEFEMEEWEVAVEANTNAGNEIETIDSEMKVETEYDAEMLEEAVKNSRSFWKCQHCGYESEKWASVCEKCGWIAEFRYQDKTTGGSLVLNS